MKTIVKRMKSDTPVPDIIAEIAGYVVVAGAAMGSVSQTAVKNEKK